MKCRLCRVVFAVGASLCISLSAGVVSAQEEEEGMVFDEDEGMVFEEDDVDSPPQPDAETGDDGLVMEDEGDGLEIEGEDEELPEPSLEDDLAALDEPTEAAPEVQTTESLVSWQDIVVVVRKPFLKQRRFELTPVTGITLNDNIIQHLQFGGQLSYYLTDVLSVGLEGFVYLKNLRDPFDQVAFQARRLPAVNQYNYSAALNFNYVPVYGKFAVLDQYIIHWESYFTGGVGFTQSEVIPRDPAQESFSNFLITPSVGVSMRFFLSEFLTVTVGVRDYIFVDTFEAAGRMERSGDAARENGDSALVNNIMFQAGVSFWWPLSFEYTTFR